VFGGGADGTTCACDAHGDGVTDPSPINGNDRRSLTAGDDGGYFRERPTPAIGPIGRPRRYGCGRCVHLGSIEHVQQAARHARVERRSPRDIDDVDTDP
jgi:hypothetical protein